jgi:hypothetical protein
MQKLEVQMSISDIYNDVCVKMEDDKPAFLALLDKHIDFEKLISWQFNISYYRHNGRPREYTLISMIKFSVLKKIIGISQTKTFLTILKMSKELRDYCGFDSLPDESQFTRFYQEFSDCIKLIFDNLVEITEPICREINAKKADYLIYDPTGIEVKVAENNPKFLHSKVTNAKKLVKKNPDFNPYTFAYSQMPECAAANPFVKQQYINGHFCYAFKAGILSNGFGIIRDIAFFDEDFKRHHPEIVTKKTDNPEFDKEISDSVSLKPVLGDFFKKHPTFSYGTFLGDSAFDKYDTYSMLRKDFKFKRMAIPLNKRNSGNSSVEYDDNGTPVCPLDKTPMIYIGKCGGKNRSLRFKYVCHKSEKIKGTSKRKCICQTPCTTSSYGKCVYTYPDKNLRLYPGIARGTEHFDNLYRHRVFVERSIYSLKVTLGVGSCLSYSSRSVKSDLFFAGITQLIGLLLAHSIGKSKLCKSIRKLVA